MFELGRRFILRNKHFILTLIVLATVMISLSACGGNSSGNNKSSEGQKKDLEVQIVESGYSVNADSNIINYAFVIQNPNDATAYDFPKVNVTAYDENNQVLANHEQTMHHIEPGEKQAFGAPMSSNGKAPTKVDFTVSSGEKTSPSDQQIKSSDLIISGVNERPDMFSTKYTGTVKNNSAIDTSMIGVTVILKNGGQIVYGTTTFVNDVKAGAEKPFEVSTMGTIPEHDAVEVTAIQWGY